MVRRIPQYLRSRTGSLPYPIRCPALLVLQTLIAEPVPVDSGLRSRLMRREIGTGILSYGSVEASEMYASIFLGRLPAPECIKDKDSAGTVNRRPDEHLQAAPESGIGTLAGLAVHDGGGEDDQHREIAV